MADLKNKSGGGGGGDNEWLFWVIFIVVFFLVGVIGFSKPFNPTFINLEYFFAKIVPTFNKIKEVLFDSHTWQTIGTISGFLSILFIGVIIYSLVRLRELQLDEKRELDHKIKEALAKDREQEQNKNPRWKYITNLIESPNESDWRIAIIEADNMLDESLSERGYEGDSLGEKLKGVSASNFDSLQNAWDAHNFRNQIAHQGLEFPISQVEARRVIRMFQNVFEELKIL